jgi:arabinan endo-1,5-alpha-L-arabinosidase
MGRTSRIRAAVLTSATAVGIALLAPVPATAAPPGSGGQGTAGDYVNPVSRNFADTFADPAVIRGKDGWWYSYGTTDPLREGDPDRNLIPISKSRDLVDWQYVGDAFTEATLPDWADRSRNAALWAPDIRFVNGQYRLYYVVTETTTTGVPETTTEINDNAIGVATAPSPAGPWTDSGDPVVDPRRQGPDNYLWTFDPHHVATSDGREYLFFGSYYGGIFVTELTENGTEATGPRTQVAIDNKYEGAYVIQRNGWWYLFASSANCCAGPTTGYSVHVGRSRDLAGPYVDREGVPLNQSRAGGTPVIAPNGNTWVGPGHNAVVTDLAGQDWIVYHAIDRADPYLNGTEGINERPMLIDRLDWIDGWPTARAGAWASEDRQRGPVTGGKTVTDFSSGVPSAWTYDSGWALVPDSTGGTSARTTTGGDHSILTKDALPRDVRVEADLRRPGTGPYGLQAAVDKKHGKAVSALIDPASGRLVVRSTEKGRVTGQATAPLPANIQYDAWKSLVLEIRKGVAVAELTHARLGDPLARVVLRLPGGAYREGQAGAVGKGADVFVDNLSALKAADLVTKRVHVQQPGRVLFTDEFNGSAVGSGWTEVRDPDYTVSGGRLNWTVEDTDLVGTGNDAGLLLRDAPDGKWTAETKLTIDLGVDEVRNFQQGGLVAYVNDDEFLRLSHVAIWNTRQTEFGKEMPYAGRLQFGGTIVGPPSDTTWLRLTHRTDRNGEHEIQASTSTDGRTWIHGGVWTLPAGSDIQVGLISHGRQGGPPPATSQFDWFRVYGG